MKNPVEEYVEKLAVMPLVCWDIFSQFTSYKNEKHISNINELLNLSYKFKWKNDINSILTQNKYEALVLTNVSKSIIWVDDGFSQMTGYSKKYAINKKPSFLQGAETKKDKIKSINKKILKNISFKETIINYKKDGTPYKCELHIFPLKTHKITHYLALERAV